MRRIISRQRDTRWELSYNLYEVLFCGGQFIITAFRFRIRGRDKQEA